MKAAGCVSRAEADEALVHLLLMRAREERTEAKVLSFSTTRFHNSVSIAKVSGSSRSFSMMRRSIWFTRALLICGGV